MRFVPAAALASLVLIGCSPPPSNSIQLTLGTTATTDGSGFVPLTGEQPLVPGAQGGFHLWLKMRVAGMAPRAVRAQRTARRVSDGRLLLTTEQVLEVGAPGPEGYWELPVAIPSFMCPSPIGVSVVDTPARFMVRFVDDDGRTVLVEENAEATPVCPPEGDPQREFCYRICTG